MNTTTDPGAAEAAPVVDCAAGLDPSAVEPFDESVVADRTRVCNRLSRISGQVVGIKGMFERHVDEAEIAVQCAAVAAAISSLERELLARHLRDRVAQGLRENDHKAVADLMQVLKRLVR